MDVPAIKISGGRLVDVGEPKMVPNDFSLVCADAWPDLAAGAKVCLLPEDDFQAIISATEGRPILATRKIIALEFKPPARAAPPTRWARVKSFLAELLTCAILWLAAVGVLHLVGLLAEHHTM